MEPLSKMVTARCTQCGAERTVNAVLLDGRPVVSPLCHRCWRVQQEADALRAEQKRQAEQTQREAVRRQRAVEALAVPPLYDGACIANTALYGSEEQQVRTHTVRRFCEQYVADWPHVQSCALLVFTGACGTGKTRMAYAVARALVEQHAASARVVKLKDVVLHVRGAWAVKQDGEEQRRVASWVNLDLLVLDEVSEEGFGGNPRQVLYDVLNGRYEAQRPTIITTHASEGQLAALLGEPLMDRIAEVGGVVDFGRESYRRTRGGAK